MVEKTRVTAAPGVSLYFPSVRGPGLTNPEFKATLQNIPLPQTTGVDHPVFFFPEATFQVFLQEPLWEVVNVRCVIGAHFCCTPSNNVQEESGPVVSRTVNRWTLIYF